MLGVAPEPRLHAEKIAERRDRRGRVRSGRHALARLVGQTVQDAQVLVDVERRILLRRDQERALGEGQLGAGFLRKRREAVARRRTHQNFKSAWAWSTNSLVKAAAGLILPGLATTLLSNAESTFAIV